MSDEWKPRERKPLDDIQWRYLNTLASMVNESRPNLGNMQRTYLNWMAMEFQQIDEFCEKLINDNGGTPEDIALLYRNFDDVSLDEVPDNVSGRTKPPGELEYNPASVTSGWLQEEIDKDEYVELNVRREKVEQYVLFCRPYLLHFLWRKYAEVN